MCFLVSVLESIKWGQSYSPDRIIIRLEKKRIMKFLAHSKHSLSKFFLLSFCDSLATDGPVMC